MLKIFKLFAAVLGTILVGAIGSGVWEKLLSPLLSYISGVITYFFSSISSSYENAIYANASTVEYGGQSNSVIFILLFLIGFVCLFNATKSIKNSWFTRAVNAWLLTYVEGWTGVFTSICLVTLSLFIFSSQSSTLKVRKYSFENMQILRPYIGDNQYHFLYSSFVQVKSKSDFEEFVSEIEKYSAEHKLEISKFTLK
ncbi:MULTISPECIES: hypothetical protein [Vibrio]|uniref:hypothetical protein n=1 Tax=Vibrio TaxID=662 RepID=UPI0002E3DF5A|nr:hypothetical protein [Vibrio splendidus]ANP78339.1 hypothetical protein A134_18405 [Vibrio crassostreae 9CS106]PTP93971.1 hypothetical protein CWO02_06730 [Vibrio splendidus]